jgi:hypothetical protein
MAPAGPPTPGAVIPAAAQDLRDTALAFLARYGGTVAALLLGRRTSRPGAGARPAERGAAESLGGFGGQSEASGAMRSGAPR